MKDLVKKLVTGTIRLARNLFYRRFYRKQIRRQFLAPSDSMSLEYSKEIDSYWQKFGVRIKKDWHRWYSSRNGLKDVRYIPEDLYYCRIEPALNKEQLVFTMADKTNFDLLMPDFKRPATVIRNVNGMFLTSDFELITKEKAIDFCSGTREIVIKPTLISGGGRKIEFIVPGEGAATAKQWSAVWNHDR